VPSVSVFAQTRVSLFTVFSMRSFVAELIEQLNQAAGTSVSRRLFYDADRQRPTIRFSYARANLESVSVTLTANSLSAGLLTGIDHADGKLKAFRLSQISSAFAVDDHSPIEP
jgi:hypothetical protein